MAGPAAAGNSTRVPQQTTLQLLLGAVALPGAALMTRQQAQTPRLCAQRPGVAVRARVQHLLLLWLLLESPACPQAQASCVRPPASGSMLRLWSVCLPSGWGMGQGSTPSCSGG